MSLMIPNSKFFGFDPKSISNFEIWLDSSDLPTITKDANDKISQWDDKSGNGNHVTQATQLDKPTWVDSVQNGKPIIRFNGLNEYIRRLSFTGGDLAHPITIFLVVKPDPRTGTNRHYVDGIFDAVDQRASIAHLGSNSNYYMWAGATTASTTTRDTVFVQLTALFNGISSEMWRNSTSIATGNSGSQNMGGISIGSNHKIPPNIFANVDIAEYLVYSKQLSVTERQNVENYLMAKWGL